MQGQTVIVNKIPVLIVRCKSYDKSHSSYRRYESSLRPGHWQPISHRDIDDALETGVHVLWNPLIRITVEN